jgi:subtilase family serine protease
LKAAADLDLTVKSDDITLTPASVTTIPVDIVISAVIRNSGRDTVPQTRIVLYDGFPFRERMVGEKQIEIPGQSSVRVPFAVRITDGKQHRYYVSVDPENVVKESNESNNLAARILDPETTCDFVIRSSDISVSPHSVDRFSDVKITAKVTNRGTSDARNVQLRYTLGEPGNRLVLATITADIPAGQAVSREVTWRPTRSGVNLPITVSVDPYDSFQELSEANNRAVTTLTVQDPTP